MIKRPIGLSIGIYVVNYCKAATRDVDSALEQLEHLVVNHARQKTICNVISRSKHCVVIRIIGQCVCVAFIFTNIHPQHVISPTDKITSLCTHISIFTTCVFKQSLKQCKFDNQIIFTILICNKVLEEYTAWLLV